MDKNSFLGSNLIFIGIVFLFICMYLLRIYSINRKAKDKNIEVKSRYRRFVSDKVSSSIFNASTVLITICLAVFALEVLAFAILDIEDENYIISIGSIFSSLLIAVTLVITHDQNKKSNKNFEASQKESRIQFEQERKEAKAQFEEHQKYLQKQQFESTFFNMMKQLEDIVSKLTLEVIYDPVIRKETINTYKVMHKLSDTRLARLAGRDVFEYFFNTYPVYITGNNSFDNIYVLGKDRDQSFIIDNINIYPALTETNETIVDYLNAEGVKNIINDLGIIGYENIDNLHILDHYFRYLYRIMYIIDEAKFLDNNTKYIDERYKYSSILRATLSPYELVFLFYNGLSYNGIKNFKPLIEKYALLNNLRPELTANFDNQIEIEKKGEIDVYSLKNEKIDDGFEYDYFRFQTDVKGEKTKYYWSAFEKDPTLFKS